MKTQFKKHKIISTILSVFISVFSVVAIVFAATTIGDNILTGGTITSAGESYLNGGARIPTLNSTSTLIDTLIVNSSLSGTGFTNAWNSAFNSTTTWANFGTNFDTNLLSKTTDDLEEGTTNLYSQWQENGTSIYYSSKNVGISTTTPAYDFVINGTTNDLFQIATSTKQGIMVVDKSGNVGVGTTNPNAKLHLYDGSLLVDSPVNPTEAGYYNTGGTAYGVYVSGKYAYVADSADGLRIINISNPASPTEVGFYDTEGSAESVYVSGKYAYVADSADGLRIIDISNPASPTETGYYVTSDAFGVYVSGKYAYVADYDDGLRIIDISNPTSPIEIGFYNTGSHASDVYVFGKYAYVADQADGLRIIDISNPTSPIEIGYYDTASYAYGVYVSGKYAYVVDVFDGLRIIDISNPTSPTEAGYYNTGGTAYGVYVSGKYAYVADDADGLRIIDVSNPASPTEIGYYNTGDTARGVYVSGKYAYVADEADGLRIIDIKGADISTAKIGNIETNDLTATENIDIGNNLYVRNGLNVGPGGIYSQGETSIYTSSPKTALSVAQSSTGDILNLFDGTTEVLTVLDGGNIGVATTTPASELTVNGTLSVGANGNEFSVNNSGYATTTKYINLPLVKFTPTATPTPVRGKCFMDDSDYQLNCYDGTTWHQAW